MFWSTHVKILYFIWYISSVTTLADNELHLLFLVNNLHEYKIKLLSPNFYTLQMVSF